ncbi:hypothetical protein IJ818_05740 [bacterium]|nr:hypothetical protein [bacterium]MBR1908418.1 hypothetical protein [bacterium]
MKKLFILLSIFFFQLSVSAKVLDANVSYDWISMAQSDRESMVSEIVSELNNSDCIPDNLTKKQFNNQFKDQLKDKENKLHYYQAKLKFLSTNDYNISGFFKGNILIMYAIQYRNDILHNYYYDVLGNLRFVDYVSYNYPEFPYFSKQYYRDGKVAAYFYYLNDNMQFIFDDKFKFKGVWQNKSMYDLNGKVVLTRGEFNY